MLIKCKECGHDVSDKAISCPNCGYPIQSKSGKRKVKSFKRNPNGFGQIRYLKGNRRNPYAAYPAVKEYKPNGSPVQQPAIGYFPTYQDALSALVSYNEKPFDLRTKKTTFKEVYDVWYESKYGEGKEFNKNTAKSYNTCINYFEPILNLPIRSLTTKSMQDLVDLVPASCQGAAIRLCKKTFDYAMMNDIVEKDYAIHLARSKKTNFEKGVPFYEDEIRELYKHIDEPVAQFIFCMILLGMRKTEFETMNVNLEAGYIRCGIKTEAGKNRVIPIHPFIKPFVDDGILQIYKSSRTIGRVFREAMLEYGLYQSTEGPNHTPHDTRHTFSWLCDKFNVKPLAKYKMIGHKTNDVDMDVYGHQQYDELLAEISKIDIESMLNVGHTKGTKNV